MLDCSPENLYDEIKAGVALREKHTKMSEDVHDQFVGEAYEEGRRPTIPSHENHAFEFYVNTHPYLVFTNPAWRVTSKRPVVQRMLAEALNHGMNRWTSDVAFSEKIAQVATDCLFDFGVVLITLDPMPGFEDKETPPLRPALHRISPRRFFQDPQAMGELQPRFMGHEWLRDLEDLENAEEPDPDNPKKKRKVYNQEVLAKISVDDGDDIYTQRSGPGRLPIGVERVPRHQVRGYEVFVPERKMIYTLTYHLQRNGDRKAYFLREPRPYFGPPWGPYILFGLYAVPDQVYPLPPLTVTVSLVQEINAHLDQVTDQADKCRQFTLVNATNDKAVNAIKEGANGDIIPIPGFDQTGFAVVTVSGPSKEQLDYVERLRSRLDRKSGLTDFQRGNVTGDATATENNLAAQAGDVRRKFMQKEFRRSVRKVGETAAWYMCESKSVVFHVPVPKSYLQPQDQNDLGASAMPGSGPTKSDEMADGLFLGGKQKGQEDFNFFDLELDIEPMSLEFTDEALYRQQMMQMFQLITQSAPMMLQMPFLNWPQLLDDVFASMNQRDGRKYINFEMLQQMTKMQFAAGQPQQIPGVDGAQGPDPAQLAQGGQPQSGVGPQTARQTGPQPGRRSNFNLGASFATSKKAGMLAGAA